MSIQLEVGKAYRTRDGRRVAIKGHNSAVTYQFSGESDCDELGCDEWMPDGAYLRDCRESDLDLIAEWTDEASEAQHETNPVALPVAGMTLRQWYAGLAMQGIVSGAPTFDYSDGCAARVATHALHLADALLAALAEREG
jgi:hypothetical protein